MPHRHKRLSARRDPLIVYFTSEFGRRIAPERGTVLKPAPSLEGLLRSGAASVRRPFDVEALYGGFAGEPFGNDSREYVFGVRR